ncbi:MAG: UDP-N-acetylmuramate:L-alanyl-gamma-D-glutamyl-meso-diaminopimelate ligase [Deltaproteobacteria bacterium]|nr:UDP-N-acetylmuramate:L-alanyl-gamma-D-glutamyl-meso-diaminopimelate ligase [Deltaproteobacteria bacterium]
MHVHLIGVCGTGMGALAGLLREAGHRVTGSDKAFHPPIGPALEQWGVETMPGYSAENVACKPDLVVVGNVCRRDNPEARAAIDGGMAYDSFPGTLERFFLKQRPGFVVAGTHGKTTTTSILAHLLSEAGLNPGLLVGGLPGNFPRSFRAGGDDAPFVIEGDEYDSAFFEKKPKFWRYNPSRVILTSVEHDHIDIYPDEASYLDAFRGLIERIPEDGLLVAFAGDPRVRELAQEARCPVSYYAVDGDDTGELAPRWLGAPAPVSGGLVPLDLYGAGSFLGRVHSPLSGRHNLRNILAALALASEGAGASLEVLMHAVSSFVGVKRRQELLGEIGGVRVYDDFAHHPTAVRETLAGLKARHPAGRLIAAFEPRSATASRRMHQALYPDALRAADLALLAPVGRKEIAEAERLDVARIAADILAAGRRAEAPESIDAVVARMVHEARSGDTLVLMSNGTFGGAHAAVLAGLTARLLADEL